MPWLLTTALLATLAQSPREPGLHNATHRRRRRGHGHLRPVGPAGLRPRRAPAAWSSPSIRAARRVRATARSSSAGSSPRRSPDWGAVVVSPDAPGRRWNNETSERGVLALIEDVRATYAIDPARILVTGYSMGGRGTWYMAGRHPDLFTAAIPMAARSEPDEARNVGDMPVFIIHPREDEVVPFEPAERTAQEMEARGQNVSFLPLEGVGHFQMRPEPLRRGGDWVRQRWSER